jgi:hypothetical protein
MAKAKAIKPPVVAVVVCIVCGKKREIAQQAGVPRAHYESDPFCSSACARKHYGTELKNTGS